MKLLKPDARLVGEWEGTLHVGTDLRLRFAIRDSGEKMTGDLTSLDQGNAKLALTRVGEAEGRVRIEIDDLAGVFEARWNNAHDELHGEWRQLDKTFPLNLSRPLK